MLDLYPAPLSELILELGGQGTEDELEIYRAPTPHPALSILQRTP